MKKCKLAETTNIHEQRIWIVEKPAGMKKVFFKKSEAKEYKTKIDERNED